MPYISATAEIMYAPFDLRFAGMASSHHSTQSALQLIEQLHPGVLIIQFRQLAHNLAAALILQRWHHHLNRHNLVAALASIRRALHAALPHAQFLPALRARRNL